MLTEDLKLEEKYKKALLRNGYTTTAKIVLDLKRLAGFIAIGEEGAEKISIALREAGLRSEFLPEEIFLTLALTDNEDWRDRIMARYSTSPITDEQCLTLYRALDNSEKISERDVMCLRRRYGLGCEQMSYNQIGQICHISRQRVQTLCNSAMQNFRIEYAPYAKELFFMSRQDLLKELITARRELKAHQKGGYPNNVPIEELGFSIRTYNCLKRAGMHTVGDIRHADLTHTVGVGLITQKEILSKVCTQVF